MFPYFQRIDFDQSEITIEYCDDIKNIRYLEPDLSVHMHQHDFYEIMLIRRGSCRHTYRGDTIPLIPGDIMILPPDDAHAFQFNDSICYNTCQFPAERLESLRFRNDLKELMQPAIREYTRPYFQRLKDNSALWGDQNSSSSESVSRHAAAINNQGIIHLKSAELRYIEYLFDEMMHEQTDQVSDYIRVKELLLENAVIHLKRVKDNQFQPLETASDWQTDMVYDLMAYIEANLGEQFDFNALAAQHNLSMSHFRKVFKKVAGLPPVEYLNRVRILRSLELLQTTYLSIAEVADAVGIHDQNYFSRQFKKMIGFPPKYYKSIPGKPIL